jgi:AP-4 complex subunit beta-1
MRYTKNSPVINKQVMERLQAPLITLMTSGETAGNFEITYIVLQHIMQIVSIYSVKVGTAGGYNLFQNDYKHFFCKMEEPTYIKEVKIDIMGYIASEGNLQDIVNELSEYVLDVNADLAKKAISCIAHIAVRVPTMAKPIIPCLLKFFKFQTDYISSQCVVACAGTHLSASSC